jgi:hypothetical protein
MFAVDDIDETLERLRKRGAHLVGEVVQYKGAYRLCYIRGPEELLIGLAQELSRALAPPRPVVITIIKIRTSLAIDHLQQSLGIPCAMYFDL